MISFVRALLGEAGIDCFVADENMSVLEGSIGALPRRVLVADDDYARARVALFEAGLGAELTGQ
jgi:hypothetical protein